MSIGERLRKQREKADLTLGQVAEYEGVSKTYISALEREINQPNVWQLLAKLALRYRCSTDYLLGLTDDLTPRRNLELPTHGPEIVQLIRELSELRRLELLRIAEALHELEQEPATAQPTLLESALEDLKHGNAPRVIGAESS